MITYRLRISEDHIKGGTEYLTISADLNCVLYVANGEIMINRHSTESADKGKAFYTGGPCNVQTGPEDSHVLRFELLKGTDGIEASIDTSGGTESRLILESPIDLDPAAEYLMRCDRVDFDLGSEALPHGHRGGGIRWLTAGELKVKQGDGEYNRMQIGDAWFESGKEPVHAIASSEKLTAFIRVSILPRELKGKSSIIYVDPEDANRSKPRIYNIYIDEPIEI